MDNVMYIMRPDGVEVKVNILLTFEANETNYVVVYEDGKEDDLFAFMYDENNNLMEVDDEEELDMVQEVVDAFTSEKEKEEN